MIEWRVFKWAALFMEHEEKKMEMLLELGLIEESALSSLIYINMTC
ncbi:hypothetical protein HanXRQr2_Chr12g0544041 [Helianthus annuus]|uniref:Uncharacterized protein n=1 Tax=Helianthus annuus TaxID=4232 RepID=A0A9K3HGW9_HELAN|nr:hypothetical protein HanXRQr2_Chr12g0544041 [Helianthus annuus]KAJ0862910.1 hypothetical protein HanPSC8_Chr12g0523751 [Helianthus annuus]